MEAAGAAADVPAVALRGLVLVGPTWNCTRPPESAPSADRLLLEAGSKTTPGECPFLSFRGFFKTHIEIAVSPSALVVIVKIPAVINFSPS